MRVLSPAKINLMLRVLGQQQDGYHQLQTYFQLLDWGDTMEFRLTESNDIKITGQFNDLPLKDNLIYKAAQLLLPHRNTNQGIKISIVKNIPQGSGLGGGSSNAGTTLRALNKLWSCDLNQQQLQSLALTLGADVPLFVLNKSAMAKGIGEKLTAYDIDSYYYVLIFPSTSIKTVDIFNQKALVRNQKEIELSQIHDKKNWTNTCLSVVLDNYPEVSSIYQAISKQTPVYMSGTGSTLFCCFSDNIQAETFINDCPEHWNVKIAKSKII